MKRAAFLSCLAAIGLARAAAAADASGVAADFASFLETGALGGQGQSAGLFFDPVGTFGRAATLAMGLKLCREYVTDPATAGRLRGERAPAAVLMGRCAAVEQLLF